MAGPAGASAAGGSRGAEQDGALGARLGAPPSGSTDEAIASRQQALDEEGRTQTTVPASGAARARARSKTRAPRAAAAGVARPRFEAGTALGHYEVIRPLGQGGMGEVYVGRDTRLGRRVALKFLLKVDAQRIARFLVEARATAQLAHENIVALHDIAEHEGLPYMVLEYVPGKTLATWLQERREDHRSAGVPPLRAAELMLPVARALACAHEAGIVHRDLKPANIMLADSGTVKVLDFGIAKLLGDAGTAAVGVDARPLEAAQGGAEAPPEDGAALTRTGAVVGTRAYMAPEQWGAGPLDGRADVWAAGVILYQMVTGEHPLAPLSPEALASVARHDVPLPSVRERLPEIGKLGALIDRCLLKRKEDRLGSARELCEQLEAVVRPHASARHRDGDEVNPYAGLAAFQERDAARFFGREAVVEQVVARLAEQPLLALVGSSGAGKSSLVRAGVIPALKRGGDAWEAFVLRPGPRPLSALAELLLQHALQRSIQIADPSLGEGTDPVVATGEHDAVVERLRREPGFLGVQLRSRARRRRERVLLFVDQFEEVHTLAAESEREAFLACLSGAADDASTPLRVIAAVRHDFLDRIAGIRREFAELMSRGTVLVGPMNRGELRSALVQPAEASEYRFASEALVDEMLDSLAGATSALPLLQFTAARLWERRDRERRLLTEASYRAFGGAFGALASHADSVLGALSGMAQRCARSLLVRLVTPERTRVIVPRRELLELGGATPADVERVLDRLIEARLLTAEGAERDETTVELIHESLIETWPTLSRWLEEEQEDAQFRGRLSGAAKAWEASGFVEGLLWRGEAAEEARRWRDRRGDDAQAALGERETRYLAAVVALTDRERRRRRQLVAALFAGLSGVLLIVSVLAIQAKQAAERARAEKAEAERSAASARNATRLAAARERQGDPTTALALLREIEPGSPPQGWTELAKWALGAGVAPVVLLHQEGVRAAAFSPDGRTLVSASADKTVRIWRADGTGEPIVLRGHDGTVTSAAFSPDGRRIASASQDKTVRVWSADGTGAPVVLRGHDAGVFTAAFSPDGQRIVSASYDKTVRVWHADGTGEPLVLRGHAEIVAAAAFGPDGQRIVSASHDKTVRVWNADGSGEPLVLRGHEDRVYAAAFSPDGTRILSASWDKTIRVWSADGTGEPLVLRGHDATVVGATFSPDGRRIVSASQDKTVRIWLADGTGQALVLRGHNDLVSTAAWSPDGTRVVSASEDKSVRVWRADGAGQPLVLRGHEDRLAAVAFSPDGGRLASASYDKTVRVWRADGTGQPAVLRGHDATVIAAAFSPDGERIVTASYDKTVRVWRADGTGAPLVLRGHDGPASSAAFSPDGERVVSTSHDKTLRIWRADGTGEPLVLRGHDAAVSSAAFSPDGERIVSSSYDRTVRVWRADGTGEPLVLRGHDAAVNSAAWSPDGLRLVSAASDKTVRVWRADGTGQPIVLRGHEAMALVWSDRPFSPDGKRVVSSSNDGTVRVWNADGTGEPLVLRASSLPVNAASWSPDGRRIAAITDDKTMIVWSDLEPVQGEGDPKLWAATSYCMPVDVRKRLLSFTEEQARADLEGCQRRVRALATVERGR